MPRDSNTFREEISASVTKVHVNNSILHFTHLHCTKILDFKGTCVGLDTGFILRPLACSPSSSPSRFFLPSTSTSSSPIFSTKARPEASPQLVHLLCNCNVMKSARVKSLLCQFYAVFTERVRQVGGGSAGVHRCCRSYGVVLALWQLLLFWARKIGQPHWDDDSPKG